MEHPATSKTEPITRSRTISKANRKRSFKSLFLTRPSSSSYVALEATLTAVGSLNVDILREIADLLSPNDILNFSLASSQLHAVLLPALYDTVILKSSRSCRKTLLMLQNNRHLCRYIRKLAVRPNYYLAWPEQDENIDEGWVVDQLIDLAPDFELLSTFDWDGLEVPRDRLWDALRLKCPMLKGVFTNVGRKRLNPKSSLFSFTDLTSFSLIIRHGLPGSDVIFPVPEQLPERFWNMILHRCPNLEELSICTFSASRLFDFDRITEGTWPALNSLTLGSFGYQNEGTWNVGPSAIIRDGRLGEFLARHLTIKYIRFLWNFKIWLSPDMIQPPLSLPPTAVPVLDTYIGIYQQLLEFPDASASKIETVDLTCEPLYENRVDAVCGALKRLTSLTSLDLWFYITDVTANGDHTRFFNSIVTACPKLTDLHLMCTIAFTGKSLKELLSQLQLLPNLKRFSLTKGHKYRDEPMLTTVLRIFAALPHLKQVNIRWAREKCPNHLKQEGTYDVVFGKDGVNPEALMVVERGIRLVGTAFRRRYLVKLPVKKTVGVKGKGERRREDMGDREWQREVGQRNKLAAARRRMSGIWSVYTV